MMKPILIVSNVPIVLVNAVLIFIDRLEPRGMSDANLGGSRRIHAIVMIVLQVLTTWKGILYPWIPIECRCKWEVWARPRDHHCSDLLVLDVQ